MNFKMLSVGLDAMSILNPCFGFASLATLIAIREYGVIYWRFRVKYFV